MDQLRHRFPAAIPSFLNNFPAADFAAKGIQWSGRSFAGYYWADKWLVGYGGSVGFWGQKFLLRVKNGLGSGPLLVQWVSAQHSGKSAQEFAKSIFDAFTTEKTTRAMFIEVGENMPKIASGMDTHKYLGGTFPADLINHTTTELRQRIRRGWETFEEHRDALTDQNVSLRLRFQLFTSVVTPTVFFGLACLPLTTTQLDYLDDIRYRMLRSIVGWTIVDGEKWADTKRRMRDRVNNALVSFPIEEWRSLFCRRLFKLAQKAIDDENDWARAILGWEPELTRGASRTRGRPPTRWDDRLASFTRDILNTASHWTASITQEDENAFVEHCLHS